MKIKSASFLKIIAILLITTAVIITIGVKCPTKMQYFIIYTLVGIGIALLFTKSAERSSLSIKLWNFGVGLSGGVVLPIMLIFTNPVGNFKPDTCLVKQSVTVFVHGKKGRQDMVLRQQGYVIMDVGSERKKAPIGENGEAYFQNLQIDDIVRLNIDFSEPYKSIDPDSVYKIDESGIIYLAIALQGIEKVKGIVLYNDKPLPDVYVKVEALYTRTDSMGSFSIIIPDSLQRKHYAVWFYKTGFKAVSKDAYPQTGIPLSIVMEK